MTVRNIPVRHRDTGKLGELAETALRHFPGWERVDQAEQPAQPAAASASEAQDTATANQDSPEPSPDQPASEPATSNRRKGRSAATTSKE